MTFLAVSLMIWKARNLPKSKEEFQDLIWGKGLELYRNLPWRNTQDPYEVILSEIMLQQTQVARVMIRWEAFLKRFPTVDALAAASTSDVLEEWQGMGYNRRALALKRMADICSQEYGGAVPSDEAQLLALPGVGPSTAAGVRAFAFNIPGVYLETNVRTVFLHELFPNEEGISDKAIRPLVEEACSLDNPRGWYYALLDYGAHLKQTLPNPSRRSKEYTRQSKFEGSRRQKRAEIVRLVLAQPGISYQGLFADLNASEVKAGRGVVGEELFEELVKQLVSEGFFSREDNRLIP